MKAADICVRHRRRILSQARQVAHVRGLPADLAQDLAHDVMARILSGRNTGLTPRGISWALHAAASKWTGYATQLTREAVAEKLIARPASPMSLLELREVWDGATAAEREAILSVLLHGSSKGAHCPETVRRHAHARARLRKRHAENREVLAHKQFIRCATCGQPGHGRQSCPIGACAEAAE